MSITKRLVVLLATAMLIFCTACTSGSIIISENPNGKEVSIKFTVWSGKEQCRLTLDKNEEIQVEITRESGEIRLSIKDKDGTEIYSGNNPEINFFTLTVPDAGEYLIEITGKSANGEVLLKNIG